MALLHYVNLRNSFPLMVLGRLSRRVTIAHIGWNKLDISYCISYNYKITQYDHKAVVLTPSSNILHNSFSNNELCAHRVGSTHVLADVTLSTHEQAIQHVAAGSHLVVWNLPTQAG